MQSTVLRSPLRPRSSGLPQVNILGVGIHAIDMAMALDVIETAINRKNKGYVCAANVHVVMEAQDSAEFKQLLNSSLMTVPDGRPLVWLGRLWGVRSISQVGGPEMLDELCDLSRRKGYTHYFYGGAPGVAEQLREIMIARYPGLRVVGAYSPPFRQLTSDEERQLSGSFASLKPDITWIGLGAPKQEKFMANYLDLLDTTVMIGVGAAFDMNTGRIKDAPRWAKKCGAAWLFRLVQDPQRLWKRYLKTNPSFLWNAFLQTLHFKKFELEVSQGFVEDARSQ